MIYVTGDTHGQFEHRFKMEAFPEQKYMAKDDYVIICGDFGGIWDRAGESDSEKYWLDWLNDRAYTLLFIDGNHENFHRIESYPEREWHGGRIHEIRPSVYHLMRGQVYEIDGKKIFTFGGAASHDISSGILDLDEPEFRRKKKKLDLGHKQYRIKNLTWWEQEMPSEEEMNEGITNLQKHNNEMDYIVTHCCSTSTLNAIGIQELYLPDKATEYLERIKNTVTYNKWFFGHYHENVNVNSKELLIYEQIIRIS